MTIKAQILSRVTRLRRSVLPSLAALALAAGCATTDAGIPTSETLGFRTVGPIDSVNRAGTALSWPGSSVSTQLTGSKLDVIIVNNGDAMLDVEINGTTTPITLQKGRFSYPIIDDAEGVYDVRLVLRGERTDTPVIFSGFEPHEGTLTPGMPADLQILVIGDSISAGYGVEGENAECGYSRETQNANLAFGPVAGRLLGADVTTIAVSGRGLTRNYDNDERPTMRALYNRLTLSEPSALASAPAMDVVIVHLGTNDFDAGDPGVGFDRNYEDFLVRLRADHPEALLIGGWGPMGQAETYQDAIGSIEGAVKARRADGDENVRFITFANSPDGQLFGCDYHPSVDTQFYMGTALAAEITDALGLDDED